MKIKSDNGVRIKVEKESKKQEKNRINRSISPKKHQKSKIFTIFYPKLTIV